MILDDVFYFINIGVIEVELFFIYRISDIGIVMIKVSYFYMGNYSKEFILFFRLEGYKV